MWRPRKKKRDDSRLVGVESPAKLDATSGVEKDFADFYREAHEIGLAHARRYLERQEAEDVVSAAEEKLFCEWRTRPPEQKTIPYFIAMVGSAALNYKKREGRLVELSEELEESPRHMETLRAPSVEILHERTEESRIYQAAVAALPERCGEVWVRRVEFKLTHQEIAAQMGITTETSEKQVQIARRRLQQFLLQAGVSFSPETTRRLLGRGTTPAQLPERIP